MARPRFHKLPSEQQEAIVGAALDEFATHGFNAASLNRIIDAAGISKGSMYYYFDDKEDLYAHVAGVELGRLFAAAGPFPVPTARDADAFWATIEEYYLRLMIALGASPRVAALARDWMAASGSPALQQAEKEMTEAMVPWFEAALGAGQKARAVRKDVPSSLLMAVVFGMGRAMDGWVLGQELGEKETRKVVRMLVDMMRGALAPRGRSAGRSR